MFTCTLPNQVSVCVCVLCVCVCVCVRAGVCEREKERGGEREQERERAILLHRHYLKFNRLSYADILFIGATRLRELNSYEDRRCEVLLATDICL